MRRSLTYPYLLDGCQESPSVIIYLLADRLFQLFPAATADIQRSDRHGWGIRGQDGLRNWPASQVFCPQNPRVVLALTRQYLECLNHPLPVIFVPEAFRKALAVGTFHLLAQSRVIRQSQKLFGEVDRCHLVLTAKPAAGEYEMHVTAMAAAASNKTKTPFSWTRLPR